MSDLILSNESNERRLTAAQFQQLADVPAAVEWFANIDNLCTRWAYQGDLQDFVAFPFQRSTNLSPHHLIPINIMSSCFKLTA